MRMKYTVLHCRGVERQLQSVDITRFSEKQRFLHSYSSYSSLSGDTKDTARPNCILVPAPVEAAFKNYRTFDLTQCILVSIVMTLELIFSKFPPFLQSNLCPLSFQTAKD